MNGSLAYQEPSREELLNGEIFMMAGASVNHNRVAGNIYHVFRSFLKGKTCEAFSDGVDVFLTENDRVMPDVMIVCNKNIIKRDGIHGTPDLVVEVLSPSTAKNDRGYKKDLYEKSGVKEYWIADASARSIETYLLSDGKFVLSSFCQLASDGMIAQEKESCIDIVSASLCSSFSIPLEEIFYNLF